MSRRQRVQFTTNSPEATEAIGERVGSRLRGGEVIELVSDLGGGKTTFVRGLARGMGSADRVTSPTFTVSKVYKAGPLELHHFDFYRLHEGGVTAHELGEAMGEPGIVTVVEWGDVVQDILPPERLGVHITKTDDIGRLLVLAAPTSLAYLVEGTEQ